MAYKLPIEDVHLCLRPFPNLEAGKFRLLKLNVLGSFMWNAYQITSSTTLIASIKPWKSSTGIVLKILKGMHRLDFTPPDSPSAHEEISH